MTARVLLAGVVLALVLHTYRRQAVQLSSSFTLGEFMRVSTPPVLTPAQEERAAWYAALLQPVRDELVQRHGDAGKVCITSYVRLSGAHAAGALDVQTCGGGNDLVRELADKLAARYLRSGQLAQVIYEPPEPGQHRAHVHIARELVPGAAAGYLVESIASGKRIYTRLPIPAFA